MIFQIGEWVNFQHRLGFVIVRNKRDRKCLVQFQQGAESFVKWIPYEQLQSGEAVVLHEKDISALQYMALQMEDGPWFMELEDLMYK